ncbi:MAG: hypothetical protein JWL63_3019 [Rhodocyclales bacterium]|nr:hypothetical protein [Rhodocyclales bacterium]
MRVKSPHMLADPALRLAPPSPALGLLGILIGALLLAVAIWVGSAARMQSFSESDNPLRAVDTARALVFDAQPATGDVRVLNVRSGVSEIARLHDRQRGNVLAISLDEAGKVLSVESSSGRYQYDTVSFRLLRREPVLAAGLSAYPVTD